MHLLVSEKYIDSIMQSATIKVKNCYSSRESHQFSTQAGCSISDVLCTPSVAVDLRLNVAVIKYWQSYACSQHEGI